MSLGDLQAFIAEQEKTFVPAVSGGEDGPETRGLGVLSGDNRTKAGENRMGV